MTNIMTKAIAKIDSQAEKSSNAYMKIIAQHIIDELIKDDTAAQKILNENKSLDELMKSIKEKAKKQAQGQMAIIEDKTVWQWVAEYFGIERTESKRAVSLSLADFI